MNATTRTGTLFALSLAVALLLSACAESEGEGLGAVFDKAFGVLSGSEAGSGDDLRHGETVVGAVSNSPIGTSIGQRLDVNALHRAWIAEVEALDTARIGQAFVWEAPNNESGPAQGTVTVQRKGYLEPSDYVCREYMIEVTIDGETESSVNAACEDEDGGWSVRPTTP